MHLDHSQGFQPGTRRLRLRAELGKIFGSLPPEPIISYCNTGHLASTNWFVLSEVLRHPRISLYDDSMQERAQDPDRLVAS